MNKLYLKFHELQTRKIHENEIFDVDLDKNDPYVRYEKPYYLLINDIYIGKIDKKENFAFLRQPVEDIYIDKHEIKNLMNDDIVIIKYKNDNSKVLEVVKRGLEFIIVTVIKYRKGFKYYTDKPLFKNIIVDDETLSVPGAVLKLEVLEITEKKIYTKIASVIGNVDDPDIDILKIVAYYNWPDPDMDLLEKEASKIEINEKYENDTRRNLADTFVVTIDGKDAKDLDDAISLEIKEDKYILGVHIADVSLYVKPKSLIDKEAYKKSTSVYMANKVIPMLPHKLSNDLCSLNPDVNKYTLSCIMEIDKAGKVLNYEILKTIIKSNYRLNYDEVNDFLKNNNKYEDDKLNEMLVNMDKLSSILTEVRRQRGELEFDSEELKFKFNRKNEVIGVSVRKTDRAENLIESFMLIANETVAFHMEKNDFPGIYRIHEKPDIVKLTEAIDKLSRLGININKKSIYSQKELQKVLKSAKGTDKEYIVNMILLRAMQKAKYSKEPLGHYGLAARYYTHFTSPIRRYPDLILHRMIRELVLLENNNINRYNYYEKNLEDISLQTSSQERVAINIERDVIDLKSCEYMLNKIGTVYDVQIIQMMKTGFFVKTLEGIEGFVNIKNNYTRAKYNENLLSYKIGNKDYNIGDNIKVILEDVKMLEREIDFLIYEGK